MPHRNLAIDRAVNPVICAIHQVPFVRFESDKSHYSFDCPVCREHRRGFIGNLRKRRKRHPDDTGVPAAR